MARLAEDMGKANKIVGDAVAGIEKILGALGIGFGAKEFLDKINSVAEAMGKLQDASEKTGASVEDLSRLQFFASVSGSNIDAVTGALARLAKGESEANNTMSNFSQALKALELSATDASGALKNPAALYGEIAEKLYAYGDGAGKTAVAIALMGKAGADQLPTMKKMVELGEIEASVTTAQAEAAEAYEVDVAKLTRQKEILWQTVTSALLPSMRSVIAVLYEATNQTDSLRNRTKTLAENRSIEDWADASAMGIARVIDVAKTLVGIMSEIEAPFERYFKASQYGWAALSIKLGPGADKDKESALTMLREEAAKEQANLKARMASGAFWSAKVDTSTSDALAAAIAKRKAERPPGYGEWSGPVDEFGQTLEKPQLKFSPVDQKLAARAAAEAARLAAAELKSYQGAVKQLENELGRLNNQTEVGKLQFELYGKDVAGVDGKMVHLEGSLEKLTKPHGQTLLMLALEVDKRKAVAEVLKEQIVNMEAMDKLYQEQAAIRTAAYQADGLYLEDLRFQIDLIGKSVAEQSKMNEMRKIELKLRADLKAAAAVAGEDMTGFNATTDLLYARAEAQKAAVLGSVAMRLKAERDWLTGANAAINDYVDSATNAAEASKTAFTNAFKNMEDALVVFMQTGKLNFKSLTDSIIADIIRIQVRQNITGPLAKELPGAISWVTTLLGSSTQAPAPVVDAIFKAEGGPVSSGSPYVVGEKGPEMFVPRSSGNILPNEALGARTTVTNIFHLSGATDTRSQAQISAAAGQGVQRAMARNT
jgi:lambda family phage tail tape measure protein